MALSGETSAYLNPKKPVNSRLIEHAGVEGEAGLKSNPKTNPNSIDLPLPLFETQKNATKRFSSDNAVASVGTLQAILPLLILGQSGSSLSLEQQKHENRLRHKFLNPNTLNRPAFDLGIRKYIKNESLSADEQKTLNTFELFPDAIADKKAFALLRGISPSPEQKLQLTKFKLADTMFDTTKGLTSLSLEDQMYLNALTYITLKNSNRQPLSVDESRWLDDAETQIMTYKDRMFTKDAKQAVAPGSARVALETALVDILNKQSNIRGLSEQERIKLNAYIKTLKDTPGINRAAVATQKTKLLENEKTETANPKDPNNPGNNPPAKENLLFTLGIGAASILGVGAASILGRDAWLRMRGMERNIERFNHYLNGRTENNRFREYTKSLIDDALKALPDPKVLEAKLKGMENFSVEELEQKHKSYAVGAERIDELLNNANNDPRLKDLTPEGRQSLEALQKRCEAIGRWDENLPAKNLGEYIKTSLIYNAPKELDLVLNQLKLALPTNSLESNPLSGINFDPTSLHGAEQSNSIAAGVFDSVLNNLKNVLPAEFQQAIARVRDESREMSAEKRTMSASSPRDRLLAAVNKAAEPCSDFMKGILTDSSLEPFLDFKLKKIDQVELTKMREAKGAVGKVVVALLKERGSELDTKSLQRLTSVAQGLITQSEPGSTVKNESALEELQAAIIDLPKLKEEFLNKFIGDARSNSVELGAALCRNPLKVGLDDLMDARKHWDSFKNCLSNKINDLPPGSVDEPSLAELRSILTEVSMFADGTRAIPNGQTIGEWLKTRIDKAQKRGNGLQIFLDRFSLNPLVSNILNSKFAEYDAVELDQAKKNCSEVKKRLSTVSSSHGRTLTVVERVKIDYVQAQLEGMTKDEVSIPNEPLIKYLEREFDVSNFSGLEAVLNDLKDAAKNSSFNDALNLRASNKDFPAASEVFKTKQICAKARDVLKKDLDKSDIAANKQRLDPASKQIVQNEIAYFDAVAKGEISPDSSNTIAKRFKNTGKSLDNHVANVLIEVKNDSVVNKALNVSAPANNPTTEELQTRISDATIIDKALDKLDTKKLDGVGKNAVAQIRGALQLIINGTDLPTMSHLQLIEFYRDNGSRAETKIYRSADAFLADLKNNATGTPLEQQLTQTPSASNPLPTLLQVEEDNANGAKAAKQLAEAVRSRAIAIGDPAVLKLIEKPCAELDRYAAEPGSLPEDGLRPIFVEAQTAYETRVAMVFNELKKQEEVAPDLTTHLDFEPIGTAFPTPGQMEEVRTREKAHADAIDKLAGNSMPSPEMKRLLIDEANNARRVGTGKSPLPKDSRETLIASNPGAMAIKPVGQAAFDALESESKNNGPLTDHWNRGPNSPSHPSSTTGSVFIGPSREDVQEFYDNFRVVGEAILSAENAIPPNEKEQINRHTVHRKGHQYALEIANDMIKMGKGEKALVSRLPQMTSPETVPKTRYLTPMEVIEAGTAPVGTPYHISPSVMFLVANALNAPANDESLPPQIPGPGHNLPTITLTDEASRDDIRTVRNGYYDTDRMRFVFDPISTDDIQLVSSDNTPTPGEIAERTVIIDSNGNTVTQITLPGEVRSLDNSQLQEAVQKRLATRYEELTELDKTTKLEPKQQAELTYLRNTQKLWSSSEHFSKWCEETLKAHHFEVAKEGRPHAGGGTIGTLVGFGMVFSAICTFALPKPAQAKHSAQQRPTLD